MSHDSDHPHELPPGAVCWVYSDFATPFRVTVEAVYPATKVAACRDTLGPMTEAECTAS